METVRPASLSESECIPMAGGQVRRAEVSATRDRQPLISSTQSPSRLRASQDSFGRLFYLIREIRIRARLALPWAGASSNKPRMGWRLPHTHALGSSRVVVSCRRGSFSCLSTGCALSLALLIASLLTSSSSCVRGKQFQARPASAGARDVPRRASSLPSYLLFAWLAWLGYCPEYSGDNTSEVSIYACISPLQLRDKSKKKGKQVRRVSRRGEKRRERVLLVYLVYGISLYLCLLWSLC